jgi:hypothetical protein
MVIRPVTAATNTIAEGTPPRGSEKPRVNIADPAPVKADPRPMGSNGQSSSTYPAKEIPSQTKSCASRIAGARAASTRSRSW